MNSLCILVHGRCRNTGLIILFLMVALFLAGCSPRSDDLRTPDATNAGTDEKLILLSADTPDCPYLSAPYPDGSVAPNGCIMVRPGNPATLTLEVNNANAIDADIEFGVNFPEADSLLNIQSTDCIPQRPSCEIWTISVRDATETSSEFYSIPVITSPRIVPAGEDVPDPPPVATLRVFVSPLPDIRVGAASMELHGYFGLVLDTAGTVWVWGSGGEASAATMAEQLPEPAIAVTALRRLEIERTTFFALLASGRVWQWDAMDGRLGGRSAAVWGEAVDSLPPNIVEISGELALSDDGAVYRWSYPADPAEQPYYRLIDGLPDFETIHVLWGGDMLRLGVDDSGQVWEWRRLFWEPVPIDGLPPIAQVDGSESTRMALDTDGVLWMWGDNRSYQIDAGPQRYDSPVRIRFPDGAPPVVDIAASVNTSAALVADGTVWVWGSGRYGKFGNGESGTYEPLRAEPGLVPDLADVIRIDGGPANLGAIRNSCAEGGSLLVWGRDGQVIRSGQVIRGQVMGVGGPPRIRPWPTPVNDFGDTSDCSELEVTVFVSGEGRVRSTSGTLDCGDRCTQFGQRDSLITLMAEAGEGTVFAGWDWDCAGGAETTTVQLTENLDCLANFIDEERPLPPQGGALTVRLEPANSGRVTSDPAGIDCGSDCAIDFLPGGTEVTLTAAAETADRNPLAAALYKFDSWAGQEDCADAQVTIDGDVTCIARFARVAGVYTLDVEIRGEGNVRARVIDGTEFVALGDCRGPTTFCSGVYGEGTTVLLDLDPDSNWEVVNVFGACAQTTASAAETSVSGDQQCTVVFEEMSEDAEMVASFTVDNSSPVTGETITFDGTGSYVLDPSTGGQFPDLVERFEWDFEDDGTFDASGPPATAARVQHSYPDTGFYDVRLRVTGQSPQDGSTLTGQAITTIQVGEDNPSGPGPFVLTVRQNGTNRGTVEVDPAGPGLINTDSPPFTECTDEQCSQNYYAGTQVTLTAVATVIGDITGERDLFVRWEGASCPVAGSTNATETITMDNNALCAAFFREVRELTVRVSGDGSVTTTPPEIVDCTDDCSAFFDARTVVTMTPTPGPGQRFSGWAADNDCEDGEVTMFADRLCIAQFDPIGATVTLTVDVDGGPQDRVRTGDGRIDCPGTCEADYAPGTSVNIFAEPGPGASFGGWTQDCAIYQTQTGINLTLDSDTLCGAFFE